MICVPVCNSNVTANETLLNHWLSNDDSIQKYRSTAESQGHCDNDTNDFIIYWHEYNLIFLRQGDIIVYLYSKLIFLHWIFFL